MAEGTKERQSLSLTVSAPGGDRIDVYLAAQLPDLSRTRIKSIIVAGLVTCNDEVVSPRHLVSEGDQITVQVDQVQPKSPHQLTPAAVPFEVLFEDENLLVLNKPAGITVHPGAGTKEPTLIEGLLHYWGQKAGERMPEGEGLRPGIVHRLDKDTSGVMVVAKDDKTLQDLQKQFQQKTNLREYVALLDGVMPQEEIEIESYLYRDPRNRLKFASMPVRAYKNFLHEQGEEAGVGYRYAKSLFRRHRVYGNRLTLATVRLFTGRTHQIRVHAKELGLPVVGDLVYHRPLQLPQSFPEGIRSQLGDLDQQLLHARLLGFTHPVSGRKLAFEAPLPKLFRKIVDILEGSPA